MLSKSSRRSNRKSGQAMIEFIPAVILFIFLMMASYVFFRGLRESIQGQEAARNMAFAKIANSGPLVSEGGGLGVSGQYEFGVSTPAPAMNNRNVCFGVKPEANERSVNLPSLWGISMVLGRNQRATIFRQPAARNKCD